MKPDTELFAASCLVLGALSGFLAAWTARRRMRFASPGNAEDVGYFGYRSFTPDEHPEVRRAVRAHHNALENLVLFQAVGLVHVLTGASVVGGAIGFLGFVVARIAHAYFHLRALQPWRSIAFFAGIGFVVTLVVESGVALAR